MKMQSVSCLLVAMMGVTACVSKPYPAETPVSSEFSEDPVGMKPETSVAQEELPRTYYPTELNLPVMDSQGIKVRTLVLQSQVDVFEIRDGLGRIHETLDQWINLTDFSTEPPDPPLVEHEFTSRPPKVDLTRPDR